MLESNLLPSLDSRTLHSLSIRMRTSMLSSVAACVEPGGRISCPAADPTSLISGADDLEYSRSSSVMVHCLGSVDVVPLRLAPTASGCQSFGRISMLPCAIL